MAGHNPFCLSTSRWIQQLLDPYANETFKLKKHPALEGVLVDEYGADPGWKQKFPKFNVVGYGKAGTSQLYRILATHEDVERFHPKHKEYCKPDVPKAPYSREQRSEVQKTLFDYYSQLEPPAGQLVNGCFRRDTIHLHHSYLGLGPEDPKFFIVIVRDPADWVRASVGV